MWYKGVHEYLCEVGHHYCVAIDNSFDSVREIDCPICKKRGMYFCLVDNTEGYNVPDFPITFLGPKQVIGKDENGVLLFKPLPSVNARWYDYKKKVFF